MPQSMQSIDLHTITLSPECLNALDYKFALKHKCLIFAIDSKSISIALDSTTAPLSLIANHIAKLYPAREITYFLATQAALEAQLNAIKDMQHFITLKQDLLQAHSSKAHNNIHNNINEDVAALALLDFVLIACIAKGASDVHCECIETHAIIRARIDGALLHIFDMELDIFEALSARLKIECKLDITNTREAQDGRFSRTFNNISYDFRLSFLPAFSGESIVLRILKHSTKPITLQTLGFNSANLALIKRALSTPNGIIILSGPTGAGKSTTLYAMLESIKSPLKKIITLEDPIEYHIPHTTQVLINDKQFGFDKALKALLRHDPDVLMIGEIRDKISLDIALRASLTGHLVLSTLHANDALSVIERLLDMGALDYLLNSSLKLIIAQRLARKLCNHCKQSVESTHIYHNLVKYQSICEGLDIAKGTFYAPKGCKYCHMSGYSGRVLLSEVLPFSQEVSAYIKNPHNKANALESLRQKGFKSMFANAMECAMQGLSSIEEIYRVCGDEKITAEISN